MMYYHVTPAKKMSYAGPLMTDLRKNVYAISDIDDALGKAKDMLETGQSVEIKVVYEAPR